MKGLPILAYVRGNPWSFGSWDEKPPPLWCPIIPGQPLLHLGRPLGTWSFLRSFLLEVHSALVPSASLSVLRCVPLLPTL